MRDIPHVEPLYGGPERRAIEKYLNSGGYMTEFKQTEQFEKNLARFLGVPYVSMVPNGTSALYLSLLAAGVGPGDVVVVPDFTMIATANAVKMVGAEVRLADIDAETQCLPDNIFFETEDIKAVIYVDINGRSGNIELFKGFCDKHNIVMIEDACQALGSTYNGKNLGTFGQFGCFSLGFHKIISTGQGGFVVTHTKKDYQAIERLKDFGRIEGGNDIHDHLGFNFKYTDLQAVIGIEQLKTMSWRMEQKRKIYKWYWGEEPEEGYIPWFIEYWGDDIVDAYSVEKMKDHLEKNGIQSRLLYPPIHTQKIYSDGDFPNATKLSKSGLWVPSSLTLTKDDVEYIKKKMREVNPNAYL